MTSVLNSDVLNDILKINHYRLKSTLPSADADGFLF